VENGIVCFWKRYLLPVFFTVIACVVYANKTEYWTRLFGKNWSTLEYGLTAFWGKLPFNESSTTLEIFELPFPWIVEYLMLAMCIGNYINEDLHGFGIWMLLKSKHRKVWWISKCIWCVCVNVVFFGMIWAVNISYAWIEGGDIGFVKNSLLLNAWYGSDVADAGLSELIIISVLMPFLMGLVQSLFQMICLLYVDGTVPLIIISVILAVSTYYSSKWLLYGYSMCSRYFLDGGNDKFVPVRYSFGIVYYIVVILVLGAVGYIIFRRKNILERTV
jgi:hypothetical protein